MGSVLAVQGKGPFTVWHRPLRLGVALGSRAGHRRVWGAGLAQGCRTTHCARCWKCPRGSPCYLLFSLPLTIPGPGCFPLSVTHVWDLAAGSRPVGSRCVEKQDCGVWTACVLSFPAAALLSAGWAAGSLAMTPFPVCLHLPKSGKGGRIQNQFIFLALIRTRNFIFKFKR